MTNNMNLNKFLIITPERLAKKIYKCYKKKHYLPIVVMENNFIYL